MKILLLDFHFINLWVFFRPLPIAFPCPVCSLTPDTHCSTRESKAVTHYKLMFLDLVCTELPTVFTTTNNTGFQAMSLDCGWYCANNKLLFPAFVNIIYTFLCAFFSKQPNAHLLIFFLSTTVHYNNTQLKKICVCIYPPLRFSAAGVTSCSF